MLICVVFDDGMAVSKNFEFLKKCSLQIQCDLLRAGLIPGFEKCLWQPSKCLNLLGMTWNFSQKCVGISERRIKCLKTL